MRIIEKKILPEYYMEVINGRKMFEIRKEDDVRYEVGDLLLLKLFAGERVIEEEYILCKITYVLRNFEGLKDGWVVIGIKVLEP